MLRRTLHHRSQSGAAELIEKYTRAVFYKSVVGGAATSAALTTLGYTTAGPALGLVTAGFAVRGYLDITQTSSTLKRNFPVLSWVRFLFEGIRKEIQQYFVEEDDKGKPFSRNQRAMVYRRSKDIDAAQPFGTTLDVYGDNYEFVLHSMYPKDPIDIKDARQTFGTAENGVTQPYSASIVNVSSMSYGALSSNAILALNKGAKRGGFAHWSGEGSISRFHLEGGGDLVYQVASGYFGCRNPDGTFSLEKFKETARQPQVKMIEIKLSQGAKPGKGGVLPGAKVTPLIAEARGIRVGETCVSPARHSAFSDPASLLKFAQTLREASGGKPVGIKLCVGDPIELMKMFRTMAESKRYVDFVTVDGAEGGTGAAPPEFANRVGLPLHEGLYMVHNGLRGAGIRQHTRVIASGKVVGGFSLFRQLHMGADTVNIARGFMLSLGCLQSMSCESGTCPVGIATHRQDLVDGLDPTDKSVRVYNFHHNTVNSCLSIIGACGFSSHTEVRQRPTLMVRTATNEAVFAQEMFPKLKDGELRELDINTELTPGKRLEASMQGMTMKDRLVRAWIISGHDELMPKVKLYMR